MSLSQEQLNQYLQKYDPNNHQYFKDLNSQNKTITSSITTFMSKKQCMGHIICINCKSHCCVCCNSPIENGCSKFLSWTFQQKNDCNHCKCDIKQHQMTKCMRNDCKDNGGPPQHFNNNDLLQLTD